MKNTEYRKDDSNINWESVKTEADYWRELAKFHEKVAESVNREEYFPLVKINYQIAIERYQRAGLTQEANRVMEKMTLLEEALKNEKFPFMKGGKEK